MVPRTDGTRPPCKAPGSTPFRRAQDLGARAGHSWRAFPAELWPVQGGQDQGPEGLGANPQLRDKGLSSETPDRADSPALWSPPATDSLSSCQEMSPGGRSTLSLWHQSRTVEAELTGALQPGTGSISLPRSPHRTPSLSRSQPSPDRWPLRFRVDRVTRPRAGCVLLPHLPAVQPPPLRPGAVPWRKDTGYSALASQSSPISTASWTDQST